MGDKRHESCVTSVKYTYPLSKGTELQQMMSYIQLDFCENWVLLNTVLRFGVKFRTSDTMSI